MPTALPVLDLPPLARVRRGPYEHAVSATRWSADGQAEALLKFGPTLRGAIWVPVAELTHGGQPVRLKVIDPEQARIDAGIAAEERFWADLRVARRQDALERPARR